MRRSTSVEELERAERLPEKAVGAALSLDRGVLRRGREQDDSNACRLLVRLQAPAELVSAHAWKPEVEHDRIGPAQPDGLEGGFCGRGFLHLDVHDLEGRAEKRPKCGVVVDDQ